MKKNFRFFDNRQKYLLFVTTTNEKNVIADIDRRGSLTVNIFLALPWGVKSHENISPSSKIDNCAVNEKTSNALPTS